MDKALRQALGEAPKEEEPVSIEDFLSCIEAVSLRRYDPKTEGLTVTGIKTMSLAQGLAVFREDCDDRLNKGKKKQT